jgi:hypothetical protein
VRRRRQRGRSGAVHGRHDGAARPHRHRRGRPLRRLVAGAHPVPQEVKQCSHALGQEGMVTPRCCAVHTRKSRETCCLLVPDSIV